MCSLNRICSRRNSEHAYGGEQLYGESPAGLPWRRRMESTRDGSCQWAHAWSSSLTHTLSRARTLTHTHRHKECPCTRAPTTFPRRNSNVATEVGPQKFTHETRMLARMSAVNPIQMWKEASWRPNLGLEVMDELRQSVTHCLNIVASGGEYTLCTPLCTRIQTRTRATQQNAFCPWSVSTLGWCAP